MRILDVAPSLASVRDEREIKKKKRRDERVERKERREPLPSPRVAKAQTFGERGIDEREREREH
jgi:hypothetical protein